MYTLEIVDRLHCLLHFHDVDNKLVSQSKKIARHVPYTYNDVRRRGEKRSNAASAYIRPEGIRERIGETGQRAVSTTIKADILSGLSV